jgi:hypothetical protein
VQIYHIKMDGYRTRDGIAQLWNVLKAAKSKGLRGGCGPFPEAAGEGWLVCVLTYLAQLGEGIAVGERLNDPKV